MSLEQITCLKCGVIRTQPVGWSYTSIGVTGPSVAWATVSEGVHGDGGRYRIINLCPICTVSFESLIDSWL